MANDIPKRLEIATQRAEEGSAILYHVAYGDSFTEVDTLSGPVPSLKKWYADLGSSLAPLISGIPVRLDKSIMKYMTKSDALAASSSLPVGQSVNVYEDESSGEESTEYKVSSPGNLVRTSSKYKDNVAPAYLKTISDILNLQPISLFRNIPQSSMPPLEMAAVHMMPPQNCKNLSMSYLQGQTP